jgi:hypothetical protein
LNLITEETTAIQAKFRGSLATTENQPLDEFGRSRKIKGVPPIDYTVGWPIYSSGQARGTTFIASVKMSVQTFNDEMDAIFAGDSRWIRNRLLASIFINTVRLYDDVESPDGTVNVYPLANGDATLYVRVGVVDSVTTDDHYLAFLNPISDANNPLPAIRTDLVEHPYNVGEVVVFVSSNLYDDGVNGIAHLTGFIEWGGNDPALSQPLSLTPLVQIIRPLNMRLPPSATYRGRANFCHIVEWPSLPAGYGFAITTGGPRPLRRRVDPEGELRGFKPVAERDDWPYFEDQWIRRMGFGAWNRVAMVAFLVGAGAYAIPAMYANMEWA